MIKSSRNHFNNHRKVVHRKYSVFR